MAKKTKKSAPKKSASKKAEPKKKEALVIDEIAEGEAVFFVAVKGKKEVFRTDVPGDMDAFIVSQKGKIDDRRSRKR